jgi:hypothetical protein
MLLAIPEFSQVEIETLQMVLRSLNAKISTALEASAGFKRKDFETDWEYNQYVDERDLLNEAEDLIPKTLMWTVKLQGLRILQQDLIDGRIEKILRYNDDLEEEGEPE